MPIPFSGEHLRRLQTALLDTFDYGALRQMLQIELDADLDHLVPFRTATMPEMVHDLIRHYTRRPGGIQQLIKAAHNTRPADVELSALYQEWISLDFAPLAAPPPATAHIIPQQRPTRSEHFLDRQQALADLLAALHSGAVVTLCGPGGIGKTALAAEALWQLPGERFPDGIITHSFYGRGQIALACEHIARTFGEELKPDPRAAAQRALAGRQLLLFLDGAEEADDLPALLALRGSCGVLVTSRRRSDALAVRQDVDPLPPADAIALLQAWGGPRANDAATAGAIAELVGRLPLALRLVGRYLAQTDEEATDYLAWLSATPLTALDQGQRRHESVPLLLERSLQQVSHDAHTVLAVVGCLALAPFDRSTIAAAIALPSVAVQRPLGELVNYSLLQRGTKDYSVTHRLIHTYVHKHLTPTGLTLSRLTVHFTTVIKAQASNFDALNNLRPHVIALLSACTSRHIWKPVLDLAWAIYPYLDLHGFSADRLIVTKAALAAAKVQHDLCAEGAWLCNLGLTYYALGQIAIAIDYYQQALTISQQIGDRRGEGVCLGYLGLAYNVLGQIESAINYHRQALIISQEIGDRRSEGADLGNLGMAYYTLGQAETAIAYYQQALVIAQKIGDQRGEGTHLGHLGIAYFKLGKVETAVVYYQQALTISQGIGDRSNEGVWLSNLGQVYYAQEQMEVAIAYYQQAIAIAQEIGDRRGEGARLGNLGLVYAALGQGREATDYYEQALAIAREVGDRHNEEIWLRNLDSAEVGAVSIPHNAGITYMCSRG